ncbi:LuxR C-terminal-related transcriptional regulator [Nocardia sp. NPDC004278]
MYDHVGAQRDSARVRARLQEHGVWPARRARSDVGRTSASLTPPARAVADLVTEECTNAAIANRLSVSKRPVDNHVSKILAELEFRSHIQIAGVLASPQATARMSEQTDTLAI